MLRGLVTGSVVSTRKSERLVGSKLMEVELSLGGEARKIIAVDSVGAGIGEEVLVTLGSSARLALRDTDTPTDAVIVGIIDQQGGGN